MLFAGLKLWRTESFPFFVEPAALVLMLPYWSCTKYWADRFGTSKGFIKDELILLFNGGPLNLLIFGLFEGICFIFLDVIAFGEVQVFLD